MILETAVLNVRVGEAPAFEASFRAAEGLLSSMPGYLSHELLACVEVPSQYLLLVRWATLEDHTEGFRGSEQYHRWKTLLHHYYDPFPTVEHYRELGGAPIG